MDFTNTPRKYLIGFILVIVLILAMITSLNPGTLMFRDPTDYDAQRKVAEAEAQQYNELLASLEPNYEASQQLLEKIATEDIVKKEVETALKINQKVTIPTVADSEFTIAPRGDRPAMVDYVTRLGSIFENYNTETELARNQVYGDSADSNQIVAARAKTERLAQNLRGLPVPAEALPIQKAYLVAYDSYESFLNTAAEYAKGINPEPWDENYNNYRVIDNRLAVANIELDKLSKKYALDLPMPEDLLANSNRSEGFSIVKTANAQIGITTVIDIKAAAEVGIRAGLARSFAKFATTMLDKLVGHIEKSFAIASQLYYSQDLGRYYSVEYMKKFVADPTEQDIIQKFLPQYFCVNPKAGELKQIFTAKARANQGSDIVIDPNDPQFLDKLARLGGDARNYPQWWEEYYTTLAAQTQQAAEAAATKEVLSPGLKSGRDIVTGQINKTMSSIFNVQQAAISGSIQLGTSNAENVVSQIVAGIVENMVNKFVFTPISGGASSGGGGIGVIGEKNVCLNTAQLKPIVSVPSTPTFSGN